MKQVPKFLSNSLPFQDPIIQNVISTNQMVVGPHVEIFEEQLKDKFGYKYANSTSNGFSALLLSIISLGITNSKIIVPQTSTCHAVSNAVLASGNEVVFCKIDPNSLGFSTEFLEELISTNDISAIIAVSHFGIPAEIAAYKKYGIPIIEDACQAFFSRIELKSDADILILSFYPTKHFNCIDGGAILHNSHALAEKIIDIRYYDNQPKFDGKTRYNFRMANLHAAFGVVQFNQIEIDRNSLMDIKLKYLKMINNKELFITSQIRSEVIPWRFLIKKSSSDFISYLKSYGIQVDLELINVDDISIDTPEANWIEEIRSIPYYSKLSIENQIYIIDKINAWNE